jgi:hypothetical protein
MDEPSRLEHGPCARTTRAARWVAIACAAASGYATLQWLGRSYGATRAEQVAS